jgi:hypothetical protein
MLSNVGASSLAPSLLDQLIAESGSIDLQLDLPSSLIEADAIFHNLSVEEILCRYLLAKLREVSQTV